MEAVMRAERELVSFAWHPPSLGEHPGPLEGDEAWFHCSVLFSLLTVFMSVDSYFDNL